MENKDFNELQRTMVKDFVQAGDMLICKSFNEMYKVDSKGEIGNGIPFEIALDNVIMIYRKMPNTNKYRQVAWCRITKNGKKWEFNYE